ncbi:MAG: glycoside hydrolase family 127 protein [Draconibacterium sp.]
MEHKKKLCLTVFTCLCVFTVVGQNNRSQNKSEIVNVTIDDNFWQPKLTTWATTTVNDVFDKFEGNYEPQNNELKDDEKRLGRTRNAFLNFDEVAKGKRGVGVHDGPPWYDGLIYETIRGAADLLRQYPGSKLETRIDGYIDRIAAAQNTDPDGFINTYTQLVEPGHRWGENGGNLRWQHDVYNAGMLFEAAVHYYQASGKVKLLNVAAKLANYMADYMGPAPKHNVVPGHSGPEEAIMKLYWLFKNNPDLKTRLDVPVDENNYYSLAMFWIEARGHSKGFPYSVDEENNELNRIGLTRLNYGSYAQDSTPLFQQNTIEGHAVRATLFATGATAVAEENDDPRYIKAVADLWDNMVGKRMFISGGVGAIAHDEKFGPDYYLPNDAYLETCAAVGAGFFSQQMNVLFGQGEYIDELERVLYNSVLTGISLSGDLYTYQNPLNAHSHQRWNWHGCPCCPPMFLKMVSSVAGFIYSDDSEGIAVNLFVGSRAEFKLKNTLVKLRQETNYPWDGKIELTVRPDSPCKFPLKLRIPGWALGFENPFGLYASDQDQTIELKINGKPFKTEPFDGYVTIDRKWSDDDKIELILPMQPRFVYASPKVKDLNGLVAIASGPVVYCLEGNANNNLDHLKIDVSAKMSSVYNPGLLQGVNVIKGSAMDEGGIKSEFSAIPYYAVGNIREGDTYKVWVPFWE